MTKQEMAAYLRDLLSIMESKETAGIARGQSLADEYNKIYNAFRETLDKEKENEARTSEQQSQRIDQAGTNFSRSESSRSGPAGGARGTREGR